MLCVCLHLLQIIEAISGINVVVSLYLHGFTSGCC